MQGRSFSKCDYFQRGPLSILALECSGDVCGEWHLNNSSQTEGIKSLENEPSLYGYFSLLRPLEKYCSSGRSLSEIPVLAFGCLPFSQSKKLLKT